MEEIPWDAIVYTIGDINYGGRVTDEMDRKLLMEVVKLLMNRNCLNPGY